MTVQEYMAKQAEHVGEIVAHFVATTPEDKLDWRPEIEGCAPTRSVYEQVSECIAVNRLIAANLRGDQVAPPQGGWPEIQFSSSEDAQTQLKESARELAQAIVGMSDADLERAYTMRRGPIVGSTLIMMPIRNMGYHGGQINLYQILLGDGEFHVPPAVK